MPKWNVAMEFRYRGSVTVEADTADAALDQVEAHKETYFQQAVEEGAFPWEDEIEVEYANRVQEEK